MDLEAQVRDAILTELTRQAEESGALTLTPADDGAVTLNGRLDLETLAMAIVGAVAGGP
jgi:hypothetical protein